MVKVISVYDVYMLTLRFVLPSVAGSETTATFLSGTSFCLCRNPASYKKLVDEIRGAFKSYDEITGMATERLTYLKAVIDEGLRVYPPVPMGMPRVSPGETIDGKYVSEGVSLTIQPILVALGHCVPPHIHAKMLINMLLDYSHDIILCRNTL